MKKRTIISSREEILQQVETIKELQKKLENALKERYKIVKRKLLSTPFCRDYKVQCIEISQGFSHLELTPTSKCANWNKTVHGHIIAGLIDNAIGAVIETLINFDDELIATVDLNVKYLKPGIIHKHKPLCTKAKWNDISHYQDSIPFLKIQNGEKRFVHVTASVIQKPERTLIAEGSGWFIVKGGERTLKNPQTI